MPTIIIVLVAIVVLALVLLSSTIKIVQEYERGVIFRLGRLVGARGPGLFFLIPGVERMRKVDLQHRHPGSARPGGQLAATT